MPGALLGGLAGQRSGADPDEGQVAEDHLPAEARMPGALLGGVAACFESGSYEKYAHLASRLPASSLRDEVLCLRLVEDDSCTAIYEAAGSLLFPHFACDASLSSFLFARPSVHLPSVLCWCVLIYR